MTTALAAGILLGRNFDPGIDRPRGCRPDGSLELVAAPLASTTAARPSLTTAQGRARRSRRMTQLKG